MSTHRSSKSFVISTNRVALDGTDMQTLRALYAEVQQWSRHYETLIVNANVLLVSVSILLIGIAFADTTSAAEAFVLLLFPVLLSLIGVGLTETLFRLYASCVDRMTEYENALACFSPSRGAIKAYGGRLLPESMIQPRVHRPTSVRFFHVLYCVLLITYVALSVVNAG